MKKQIEQDLSLLKRFTLAATVIWTIILASSLTWNVIRARQDSLEMAKTMARAYFDKDMAFRQWGASHGGVYVPIDEQTPPNPYLAHIQERDITSPSGKKLTLMNPFYMLRQMTNQYADLYGVKGKITSLKALNPINEPDTWERNALKAFEQGAKEVSELTNLDGQPFLRLIRPMITQDGCLKCHGHQGYKVGDVRGGVGIAVPMGPYLAIYKDQRLSLFLTHGLVWFLGLGVLFLLVNRGKGLLLSLAKLFEEKAKSEARLKDAEHVAQLGHWELDLATGTLSGSDGIFQIFNVAPQEFAHSCEDFLDLVHPDDREFLKKTYSESVKNKTTYDIVHRILLKDGTVKYVNERGKTSYDENGNPLRSLGTVLDVTDRTQADEHVRLLVELVDIAPAAITIHDPDGNYLYVNQTACDLHGYSREELLALNIHDLDIPEDQPLIASRIKQIVETGTASFEVSHYRKDRSILPLQLFTKRAEWGEKKVILSVASDITEHKRTEQALREKENRYRTLLDQATDAIFVSDINAHLIDANRKACEGLGYTREELLALSLSDVDPNFETEQHAQKLWEGLSAGKTLTTESSHRRKDGSLFPVEIHIGKLEIGGQPAILGIARDISERKQAEEEIKEHQVFLQNALDALTHPFYIIDANDYTIKLSNKASHFGEYREGTTCFQLTHDRSEPCAGDEHPCSLREIKKTRQPVVVEHIHTDQTGKKTSVEIHAYPIFDNQGNLSQVIEYCLDISERKQGQEERSRLVTAIEQSIDSVVITDKKGMIQYVNPGFEQITGYSEEEVIGKNPRILQSGKHDALFYQEMWRTLTSGKAWQGHLINKKKDDTLFEEEVSITPVLNEVGEIINYVAVKRDVTGEMRLEEQLRQAQKMEAIGTLAGGIAHDFNNILAPILGYSEMAMARLSPNDPLAADLQQVITAAGRAKGLVQQILAFSRQAPHERKPFQPHLVVKEALKLLRASLPSTIEIREEISPDCGAIMADPTQIHQILMNLCTNAYHAMRLTGGVIGVRLSKITIDDAGRVPNTELALGNYVLLEVSDTGCGMEQKTLAHIFDPYFTTKDKGEGTGLGLAVVHGIVKSYQGHITVYSEPGKGTRFHVYLPRLAEAPSLVEADRNETIPAGTERVLVVDDEAVITAMLETILTRLGYQVRSSSNSLEALALIEQDPMAFDLLITDMTMPHLTGFELTAKALAIRSDLPVILCTGFSDLINKEQAQALGIRVYLMKPVSVRELALAVRKVLDEKREIS